jgi:hypothetical protein
MGEATSPLPHTSPWPAQRPLYLLSLPVLLIEAHEAGTTDLSEASVPREELSLTSLLQLTSGVSLWTSELRLSRIMA